MKWTCNAEVAVPARGDNIFKANKSLLTKEGIFQALSVPGKIKLGGLYLFTYKSFSYVSLNK